MSSGIGRNYPKFQLAYNEQKEALEKAINLCHSALVKSKDSREF
jgi:hypothetical protein